MEHPSSAERKILCALFGPSEQAFSFAEACFRFTPLLALRDREAVFMDLTARGCATDPAARIHALAARFGLTVRTGTGVTAGYALAAARARTAEKSLSVDVLGDLASPFHGDPELTKKTAFLAETLKTLGVRSLKDFTRIPTRTLASRFGEDAVALSRKIKGEETEAWPGFHPEEKIQESVELPEAEPHIEGILFLSRGVLDHAMARLRGRCRRLTRLGLVMRTEDRKSREWDFEFPLPQGSTTPVLGIMKERFYFDLQKKPLTWGVVRIDLEVLETAPGHGGQRDFFDSREEETENWNALVARLSHKLGNESAFSAKPVDRHLPEKAWRREISSLSEPQEKAAENPERPSRILAAPEPLRKIQDYLLHVPTHRRWRITEWLGPERLSGEWWESESREGYQRDYFRVITESGEKLWVFAGKGNDEIYLHGYFD